MLIIKKFIICFVNDILQENDNRCEGMYDEGIGILYIELFGLFGGFEIMIILGMLRSLVIRVV